MNSQSNQTNASALTLKEQILKAHAGAVTELLGNPDKYECGPCKKEGSRHAIGGWYSYESHLTSKGHIKSVNAQAEKAHKAQESQEKTQNEGTKIEIASSRPKGITNDKPEESKAKDAENCSGDRNLELTFCFTKFILENRLPFSIIEKLKNFTSYLAEKYEPQELKDFPLLKKDNNKGYSSHISNVERRSLSKLKIFAFFSVRGQKL